MLQVEQTALQGPSNDAGSDVRSSELLPNRYGFAAVKTCDPVGGIDITLHVAAAASGHAQARRFERASQSTVISEKMPMRGGKDAKRPRQSRLKENQTQAHLQIRDVCRLMGVGNNVEQEASKLCKILSLGMGGKRKLDLAIALACIRVGSDYAKDPWTKLQLLHNSKCSLKDYSAALRFLKQQRVDPAPRSPRQLLPRFCRATNVSLRAATAELERAGMAENELKSRQPDTMAAVAVLRAGATLETVAAFTRLSTHTLSSAQREWATQLDRYPHALSHPGWGLNRDRDVLDNERDPVAAVPLSLSSGDFAEHLLHQPPGMDADCNQDSDSGPRSFENNSDNDSDDDQAAAPASWGTQCSQRVQIPTLREDSESATACGAESDGDSDASVRNSCDSDDDAQVPPDDVDMIDSEGDDGFARAAAPPGVKGWPEERCQTDTDPDDASENESDEDVDGGDQGMVDIRADGEEQDDGGRCQAARGAGTLASVHFKHAWNDEVEEGSDSVCDCDADAASDHDWLDSDTRQPESGSSADTDRESDQEQAVDWDAFEDALEEAPTDDMDMPDSNREVDGGQACPARVSFRTGKRLGRAESDVESDSDQDSAGSDQDSEGSHSDGSGDSEDSDAAEGHVRGDDDQALEASLGVDEPPQPMGADDDSDSDEDVGGDDQGKLEEDQDDQGGSRHAGPVQAEDESDGEEEDSGSVGDSDADDGRDRGLDSDVKQQQTASAPTDSDSESDGEQVEDAVEEALTDDMDMLDSACTDADRQQQPERAHVNGEESDSEEADQDSEGSDQDSEGSDQDSDGDGDSEFSDAAEGHIRGGGVDEPPQPMGADDDSDSDEDVGGDDQGMLEEDQDDQGGSRHAGPVQAEDESDSDENLGDDANLDVMVVAETDADGVIWICDDAA